MHDEAEGKADSRIDLNRCGVPLLEIVSQPDMRSPAEAKAYLDRVEAPAQLLAGFRLQHAGRQPAGGRQRQPAHRHARGQGRHADRRSEEHEQFPRRGAGAGLRGRAAIRGVAGNRPDDGPGAEDDPRLGRGVADDPPAAVEGRIERLPLFPRPRPGAGDDHRRPRSKRSAARWASCRRPSASAWSGLTASRPTTATCWSTRAASWSITMSSWPRLCGDGKTASNWVQQDVLRTLNERKIGVAEFPLRPAALAEVIDTVRSGQLETNRGREVLADMIASGRSLQESMQAMGIQAVDDSELDRPLPRTAGRQPEDRRRSQGRQAQGRRATHRPGEEEEPQHQPQPGPRTVPELIEKM